MKDEKAAITKGCMRSDIRASCGLGYPPKPYTQNANECINRWLKPGQVSKCKTFTDVVKRLNDFAQDEEKQAELSLSGHGEWKLDETLSSSKYDIGQKFFQIKPHQRQQFIKQLNNEPARYDRGGEPVTSKNESQLSMSPANSGILCLQQQPTLSLTIHPL